MSGNGNGKRTLIEEGTEFKGTMSSSCPIVVMGKIEGELSGPSMEVSGSGVVAGTVRVKELRSEGEVAGEINADTVHLSGRVRDNTVIRARSLEVSLSRSDKAMEVVFGTCELAVGDEPSKEAAIAAATAGPATVDAPAAAPTPAVQAVKEEPARPRRGTAPPPS